MTRPAKHARIPVLPYVNSLLGARLVSFYEEVNGRSHEFVMNYQEFCLAEPAQLNNENGRIVERVKGSYVPRRLRFYGVRSILCDGMYSKLGDLSIDHPARRLYGVLSWIPSNGKNLFSLFSHGSEDSTKLWVTSKGCMQELCDGPSEPIECVRDWSPPPPFRAGLILQPKQLYKRYGGDPVSINLGAHTFHKYLFVGGIEYQSEQRPSVAAVLNVGEEPSRWVKNGYVPPTDRFVVHGEGRKGMSVAEVIEEANWVIARLREGQRVLVHCVAGLNRSTTICCAVLILLEGLSAEAALERVRDHHGWARPDEHHWLILKWLAKTNRTL